MQKECGPCSRVSNDVIDKHPYISLSVIRFPSFNSSSTMSLLQDVLRSHTIEDKRPMSAEFARRLAVNGSDESDDDIVNVVSLPATPDHTRPSSPVRGASARPLRGPLHISSSRRDVLRAFPTEVSQRIFSQLSIQQLAKCALVSKKWHRSQTINYGELS